MYLIRLMQAVAEHTRVRPADRIRRLLDFNARLQGADGSVQALGDWQLTLNRDLVTLDARVLENERILARDARTLEDIK